MRIRQHDPHIFVGYAYCWLLYVVWGCIDNRHQLKVTVAHEEDIC